MLKGLFKAAWKSDSAEKRLGFIANIDVATNANQTILQKLAANDIDASVRQAAISKITDPQVLYDLAQASSEHSDNKNKQVAETAFRNLIQSSNFTADDVKAFLAKNPESSLFMAKYSPLPDVQQDILRSLNEMQQADIIAEVAYSKTRVMLAEKLQSIESLEMARKHLKGKDKSAEKIIKAKIDTYNAQQKKALENAELAMAIREKMEGLARYVNWSEEVKTKFFSLKKSWESLDFEPNDAEKNAYQQAFIKVEADVKHHLAISLSQQNQQQLVSKLESLCAEIAVYSLAQLLTEKELIRDKVSDLSWQLNKESEIIPHAENIHERYVRASKALESALRLSDAVSDSQAINNDEDDRKEVEVVNRHAQAVLAAAKAVNKSAWGKEFPQLLATEEAVLDAQTLLNATQNARQQAQDALDNLHKKINRIFGAAKRGDIAWAQRDLAAVLKAANDYEGKERIKLDDRIAEASEIVSKMGDWKDFAVEPKLIELCEQMERLPEEEKRSKNPSADNLAKKIKTLQDKWKALGRSDISDTYWPRFKEAGDKAYEPCAEFFKQRQAIQQANLEQREPLISKMQDLFESTDWDAKPDYKSIEENISTFMQSWKKIKDVERSKGQQQWQKFAQIKDQINAKLDIEYDKNITQKHALTEQCEQILEEEVNEQTLDKLKFIQSKWKQIGVTRRQQDQQAWVKFKATSDAVYEKIQGLRQAKRAVEDEKIDAYKQIQKHIHQLAKTTQNLSESDKEFEQLEQQYTELPPLPAGLPEKLIERLQHDYIRACDAYAGAKDRLNQEKLDNELETLANKAKLCAELEQLPEQAAASEIAALEEQLKALVINNKEYNKRFAVRLKKARDSDREDYGKARRLLLIEAEIFLGIDSPKEDKDLRLQIQLEKMKQQGLGNTPINADAKMADLKLEWHCLPGAEAKLQKDFEQRFKLLMN